MRTRVAADYSDKIYLRLVIPILPITPVSEVDSMIREIIEITEDQYINDGDLRNAKSQLKNAIEGGLRRFTDNDQIIILVFYIRYREATDREAYDYWSFRLEPHEILDDYPYKRLIEETLGDRFLPKMRPEYVYVEPEKTEGVKRYHALTSVTEGRLQSKIEKLESCLKTAASDAFTLAVILEFQNKVDEAIHYAKLAIGLDGNTEEYELLLKRLNETKKGN